MNLRRLPALPLALVPSARLRIALTYVWRHGRLPDLRNPLRFTELVQRRKLDDRNPALPVLSDKIAAKAYVRRVLGEDWIIPTLWSGTDLPAQPQWPYPFILKSSHGCNQNVICRTPADWREARRRAARWVRRPYGLWLDEWAYRRIPRGYIAEPFLGDADGRAPVDYKIYVFGGKAAYVQVHQDRFSDHRWVLYDRRWSQVSMFTEPASRPPSSLEEMLDGAERLAQSFDFARVDFYEIEGRPKFGEVTFYPGSGLDPFDPLELDRIIGQRWLAAKAQMAAD
ncbi:ATP-grasp fold amidoligase family protein [Qipengyuania sp. ASV99]|uniref:ATP-grasp fold amidoligase family protein n=1 Tax=Qipengyuania sp. ASV99 TaxID=3399681 RepID=UPI003A4C5481